MLEALVVVVALTATGFYGLRADFQRYSIFTVGEYRRVRRQSVRHDGHTCRDCDTDIEIGEHRHYYKALVVAGSELAQYHAGDAYYCYDHSDIAIRDDLEPVEAFTDLPRWAIAVVWLVDVFGMLGTADSVSESEFENADVVNSAGNALALIPVALLVVCAALVVSFFSPGE